MTEGESEGNSPLLSPVATVAIIGGIICTDITLNTTTSRAGTSM